MNGRPYMSREELTSDSVSSFLSCRFSAWRELSFQCSQCDWFQSRRPLVTSCAKRNLMYNLSLFQPGGRRGKWQAGKVTNAKSGFLMFFSKYKTQLYFICIDCISSGWRWRTSALWSQRQASWLLIAQLDNLCYCSLGLCIHCPYPFPYPDNKEM